MKKLLALFLGVQVFLLQGQAFAQGSDDLPPARDQGMWQTMIMIGIAIVFFYVMLWRPEQKRRKAMEEQRSSLKKGDRVTAMGMIGTIDKIQDQTVIVRMYDGAKIEFVKGAITEVAPAAEEEGKDTKDVTKQ
jgi:preprotein translocase subunit YajC